MKDNLLFLIVLLMISMLTSCTKKISDIVEPTKVIIQTTSSNIETKEEITDTTYETILEVATDTIKETTEIVVEEESNISISTKNEIETESIDDKGIESEISKVTESYNNKTDSQYSTTTAPFDSYGLIDLTKWEYGMTPCEWIKLDTNIQIICNNRPNTSLDFSVKSSTGSKGCFLPVFIKTNSYGTDYDGRFYSFYDYSKMLPEEMLFSNSLQKIEYQGQKVTDILSKKYNIEKFENGVIKANGEYVNVVYIDELDSILNNN